MKGKNRMKIISFSVLLAGILLIRTIAWKYISRRKQYFIWLFAAFFLLFSPFLNISSKFSLENAVFSLIREIEQNAIQKELENQNYERRTDSEDLLILQETDNAYQTANNDYQMQKGITASEQNVMNKSGLYNPPEIPGERRQNILQNGLYYVWGGVSIIMFFIIIIFNIRFGINCRRDRVFYKKLVDWNLNVYLLKGISSPFLLGKNIYVDTDTIENEKVLNHIIIHEYCHFRHKDNFWAFIRNLCLVINWYNPFVWLANNYVKRDCELACDEAALSLLDDEEKTEYGYTLLKMIKSSNRKIQCPSIATTMSGNMKRIKERISMIHPVKKHYAFVTWLVAISMVLLTGCTFTQRGSLETPAASPDMNDNYGQGQEAVVVAETAAEDTLKSGEVPDTDDNPDKYYNVSATYYNGKTYVNSENSLYSIADNSDEWKLIYGGSVTLGAIAEGYLFFYAYPEDISEVAIMSLELSTDKVTVGQLLGDRIYYFAEMCYENNCLYIKEALSSRIVTFTIQPGGLLQEKETLSVTIPDDLMNTETDIHALSPIISRGEGYSGTFYFAKDEGEEYYSRLYYYEDSSKIHKLEGITDVMITSKGIIGRDINQYNDVYLWDIYTEEKRQLYSAKENRDLYFGYNTYDNQGLYGLLKEDDNTFYISRVNWDGSLEKLFLADNVTDLSYGINVRMSVIHDWLYYFNPREDKMERQKLIVV